MNQSRANSSYQSISDASGVDASASIFGGSRFPGTLTYSKAINSEGNYAVPGEANYVTHGNSNTFGATWSENLPDAPSFSAGFQMGSSDYSVYGTNDQGTTGFHSLNLHSSYRVAGFNMGAYYADGGGHSLIPQVVSGEADSVSESGNSSYGFNASHLLPLQGSVSAGINRSSWTSKYLGNSSTGTIDTSNALFSVRPLTKIAVSGSVNYSDNLTGELVESLISAGGTTPIIDSSQSSNSLDLSGSVAYNPAPNLQTSALIERRQQSFLGEEYSDVSYGGSASYAHTVPNGTFNAALTVTENMSNQNSGQTLGFSTTANYAGLIKGWNVAGAFSYAQNVQTLLVTYMNSAYNFTANVKRNMGAFTFTAGGGMSKTGLSQEPDTASSSQGYNASFGYRKYVNVNGSYSRAAGQALITGGGIITVPVPSPIVSSNLLSIFNGESYSIGVSSTPAKKLILSASYAKATSNTTSSSVTSDNENEQANVLVQYTFRKINFNSGFARLQQGFSVTGSQPEIVSSYYFGVSRWFNFF